VPESAWNGVVRFNLFRNLIKDSGLQASRKTFSPNEEVPLARWHSFPTTTVNLHPPTATIPSSAAAQLRIFNYL
jgi:hypothetical protein